MEIRKQLGRRRFDLHLLFLQAIQEKAREHRSGRIVAGLLPTLRVRIDQMAAKQGSRRTFGMFVVPRVKVRTLRRRRWA